MYGQEELQNWSADSPCVFFQIFFSLMLKIPLQLISVSDDALLCVILEMVHLKFNNICRSVLFLASIYGCTFTYMYAIVYTCNYSTFTYLCSLHKFWATLPGSVEKRLKLLTTSVVELNTLS